MRMRNKYLHMTSYQNNAVHTVRTRMKSNLCVALLVLGCVSGTTAAHELDEPLHGPCREWLRPNCQSGVWVCTSVEEQQNYHFGPQLGCPTLDVDPPTPPTSQCRLVNGTCQYTQDTLECSIQLEMRACDHNRYLCTGENLGDVAVDCISRGEDYPYPDVLCEPINDTCQWYNPCCSWRGFCYTGYRCGSLSEYYAFIHGPVALCAPPPEGLVEPIPLGECVVEEGSCEWSACVSYMDWCQTSWTCGTEYDREVHLRSPIPPCAPPPPDFTPPLQPGVCQFNVMTNQCQFQPDVCALGTVTCPPYHTCVPWNTAPDGGVCVRSCATDNGGCSDTQVCVERPYGYTYGALTDGQCVDTDCVAYLDWCQTFWYCRTENDREEYLDGFPPPCPAPPPDFTPPLQPGVCQFNNRTSYCQFQDARTIPPTHGTTQGTTQDISGSSRRSLVTIEVVGISIGVLAGVCAVVLVVVIVLLVMSRTCFKTHRSTNVVVSIKKENFNKYSELKFGDSVSESSVEKEDLSEGFSNEEAKEKE